MSDAKDKIYDDMEKKFKDQECKFATKEIVNNLKEDLLEVKKKAGWHDFWSLPSIYFFKSTK